MAESFTPPLPFHVFQALRQQISQNIEDCVLLTSSESPEEVSRRLERIRRRTRIRITPSELSRYAGHNNSIPSRCTDQAEDSDPYIKFQVLHQDGGEYEPNVYSLSNLFVDNEDVYCSVRPRNVNICMQHKPDASFDFIPRFMITEIVVKAPTVGFTSPILDGLIFVSDVEIKASDVARYDNYDSEQTVINDERIFYFKFDEPSCLYRLKLSKPVGGRYILLKLLRSKGVGENIDIKFFGVRGYFGPKSFASGNIL